jgi:hypothetical protein
MSKQMEKRLTRLEQKALQQKVRQFVREDHWDIFPLQKLLLLHLAKKGDRRFSLRHDMTDAMSFIGAYHMGHKKWHDAQTCVTWLALDGLTQSGFLDCQAQSKALGRQGYHYGLWQITEEGWQAVEQFRLAAGEP